MTNLEEHRNVPWQSVVGSGDFTARDLVTDAVVNASMPAHKNSPGVRLIIAP
ncbi:hypothetical protein [Mucilaginibacter lappiensis]|uniref:hypothetical protein n=1 Tax=Mucilaginibacter lappiensis TaxID=354630 RepID=UPI003D25CF62